MDCMDTEMLSDGRHRMCSIMIAISCQMIHFLCVVSSPSWSHCLPQEQRNIYPVYHSQFQRKLKISYILQKCSSPDAVKNIKKWVWWSLGCKSTPHQLTQIEFCYSRCLKMLCVIQVIKLISTLNMHITRYLLLSDICILYTCTYIHTQRNCLLSEIYAYIYTGKVCLHCWILSKKSKKLSLWTDGSFKTNLFFFHFQ